MWVSLAFITGILFAKLVSLPLFVWLIFGILAIAAAILLRRSTLILLAACLVAIFIGAARYQVTVPTRNISQIAWFNDRDYDILVTGTVVDLPDTRDTYTNLRLRVEQVDRATHQFKVSGLLLVRVQANQTYHYGDIVRVRGRLQTPRKTRIFPIEITLPGKAFAAICPAPTQRSFRAVMETQSLLRSMR